MIFLTGGLGFLGREVLARLLLSDPNQAIALLVRSPDGDSAKDRVRRALEEMFGEEESKKHLTRIRALPGDVTLEHFGMGETEFQNLATNISSIYHFAASTTLNAPLPELREINVGGTKRGPNFAEAAHRESPSFQFLHHVSTAYVAGDRKGTVGPDELFSNTSFRNFYEQSKAEAEQLLRSEENRVPFRIYRPSIIVGDSLTGYTSAFNVIYVPAKFLAKGLLKAIPALPHIPFDVVPVNYVADAIVALRREDSQQRSFHLCAGEGRESSPLEILEFIFETLSKYRRKEHATPPLLCPETVLKFTSPLSAAKHTVKNLEKMVSHHLGVLRQMLPFVPYMIANPRFDVTGTHRSLEGVVEPAPLFPHYAERLFRFCLETNWGKVPLTRQALHVPFIHRFHDDRKLLAAPAFPTPV